VEKKALIQKKGTGYGYFCVESKKRKKGRNSGQKKEIRGSSGSHRGKKLMVLGCPASMDSQHRERDREFI